MRFLATFPIAFGLLVSTALGQDQNNDSTVSIVDFKWERVRLQGQKLGGDAVPPAKALTAEDKPFQRAIREQQMRGTENPNDYTLDARSAAIEKNVQESRTTKTADQNAFRYAVSLRNEGDSKIEIIFWEYRFKELANPANSVRRQFLCAAKFKPKEKLEFWAVSTLGPSDVISAASLTDSSGKLFDEKILINRIEYADGSILQRRDWKMDEIKASLKTATSTPWGREVCRAL